MFKKIIAFLISISLAYAPIAIAQEAPPYPGWTRIMGQNGHPSWIGPSAFQRTQSAAANANTLWAQATAANKGGAAFTTTVKLGFGAGEAAVISRGLVTSAGLFSTFRAIMGGPVGLGLTAVMVAPAVIDWLMTDKTRFAPVGSEKQFEKLEETGGTCAGTACYQYQFNFGGVITPWADSPSAAWAIWIAAKPDRTSGGWTYSTQNKGCDGSVCKFTTTSTQGTGSPSVGPESSATALSRSVPKDTVSVKWVPKTIEDIRASMENIPVLLPVINAFIHAGASVPIAYAPGGTTGPASVSTVPVISTTVGPVDTTVTSTTTKSTLTYDLASSPSPGASGEPVPMVPRVSSSTNTETVTTVTNNSTGNTTTTTTNTNLPVPSPSPEPSPDTPDLCALHPEIVACASVDEVDMCKKYPESLACKKTDEPEVPDLEEIEKPITFLPDTGWGPSTGSCPAPRPLSSAAGAAFTFQPYCDFMSAIRPVLVGVAWFSGAMILVGANRKD